jgi:hypothetical protein
MCILTIKKDENLLPLRAKCRIVVLGNHKDPVRSKSDWYAPVLCGDSLRFLVSLAVKKRRPLCQGDCKNAFCQGILPDNEVTMVCPPVGYPKAEPNEYWLLQWTLYGLCCIPHHCFDKIDTILQSIAFDLLSRTPAFSLVTCVVPMIPLACHPLPCCLLASMLSILFISLRIWQ